MFLITGGRLGDRIGRRRDVLDRPGAVHAQLRGVRRGGERRRCSSPARLVQGVGGALLMPNVLSIIGVVYTGADRVRALSAYGMVMGLAAVGGQLIGGVLVQANIAGLGWRSCFLINVPIGVVALRAGAAAGARVRAPQRKPARPGRHRARHGRADRDRAAARRRPPARLAGVDVDLAGAARP